MLELDHGIEGSLGLCYLLYVDNLMLVGLCFWDGACFIKGLTLKGSFS